MGYLLGIDLGTSYTAAAVCRSSDGGWLEPEVVSLGGRSATVASVLFLAPDGSVLVGEAAERRALTDPDRVVREFKRRVGDPTPIVVAGRNWAPEELSARLVRWVVDRVAEREGGPADGTALTHPASWGSHKKDLLAKALATQGLSVGFLAEPQAAALHYASTERVGVGSTIAVYDLGGGTFDAAVVRKGDAASAGAGPAGFGLLGRPERLERLGGIDFDEVVFEHVRAGMPDAFENLDDHDPAVLSAVARIRRDCTEAKEALSSDTEVSIPVLLPTARGSVRLHRSEFEQLIRPQVEETVEALRRAVNSAGLAPEQLSAVLLVGGSSRIPLIAELVSEQLGRPVIVADPKIAIAEAAASSLRGLLVARSNAIVEKDPTADYGLEDDAQFAVYRPANIRPLRWYPLLVFAYRSDPFIDADTGELVDPGDLVTKQADQLLRDQRVSYRAVTNDSEVPLPRGAEIILQPWLSGGDVNPAQASLRWEEPTHRVEFRLRVSERAESRRRAAGGLRVFLGPILVAEVSFTIAVTADSLDAGTLERIPVRRYRQIFASYSHLDANIVQAVASLATATGDRYMLDTVALRSGEQWAPRLIEFIHEADIFQLFWSRNAMNSRHVRREWEHALSLKREGFIRPVYWESPRPVDSERELPPAAIERLHWARLPVDPISPAFVDERRTESIRAEGSDSEVRAEVPSVAASVSPPQLNPPANWPAPTGEARFTPKCPSQSLPPAPSPKRKRPDSKRRPRAILASAITGIGLLIGSAAFALSQGLTENPPIAASPTASTAATSGTAVPGKTSNAPVGVADCQTPIESNCETKILEASRAVWPDLPRSATCSVNESEFGVDLYSTQCKVGAVTYSVFWRKESGSIISVLAGQMIMPTLRDFSVPSYPVSLGEQIGGSRRTESGDRFTCAWEYADQPVTMVLDGPNDDATVALCQSASFLDPASIEAARQQ